MSTEPAAPGAPTRTGIPGGRGRGGEAPAPPKVGYPRAYQVQVSDTGPGIPPGDADRIFDRFVRLAAPGSEGGGGLGLPIARWIAEAHGGTLVLGLTSAAGTTFVATLPAGSISED